MSKDAKDADVDRLTRPEIEYLVGQFALLAARADWKPKSIDRIRAFGDLALQSLSQEAVREEALEEAARVCENLSFFTDVSVLRGMSKKEMSVLTCKEAAAAIRALKREPNAAAPEPQVMGRVHNDRDQGEAWLNSVGRELPDGTPLYAAAQAASYESLKPAEHRAGPAPAAPDEQDDKEIGEFQQRVYELCEKFYPYVDGAGSDTGDWRDFTLAEIRQTLNHLAERPPSGEMVMVRGMRLADEMVDAMNQCRLSLEGSARQAEWREAHDKARRELVALLSAVEASKEAK